MLLVAGVVVVVAGQWMFGNGYAASRKTHESEHLLNSFLQADLPDEVAFKHPVVISQPSTGPRVETGLYDIHGQPVTASCQTCHTTREPNLENRQPEDLTEFHQGMIISHGQISCLSCHNRDDYDSLKLADGTRVDYTDVMDLCSQCHGTQRRDFDRGAHGGMVGYWDLSRGPRYRNNCVDCHDPHQPRFPHMLPTFKPRDRFLNDNPTH